MNLKGECRLLRIFTGGDSLPLAEAIMEAAKSAGLAGSTVFDGIEGFSQGGRMLKDCTSILPLRKPKESLIEIIDRPEMVEAFLKDRESMLKPCSRTVERAFVVEGSNWEEF